MVCVKKDGSCMEYTEESGSGDFGSGDFGPGDEHNIMCREGTVSHCSISSYFLMLNQ